MVTAAALATLAAFAASAQEMSATVRATRPAADGTSATRVETEAYAGELRHAADLAGCAPGAMPLDFGGALATTTVSLRGAGADEVRVVLDGNVLNSPAGGGFDLSRIPSALLDGVEVRRGSDARAGPGAMGGVVSLVPAARSRALLTAGSLGTLGASASGVFAGEAWRLLGAADVRRSDGDFGYHRDPTPEIAGNDAAETMLRRNNDALLGSALARAEWRRPGGVRLDGLLLGSRVERGLPGDVFAPTPLARQDEWSLLGTLRLRVPAGPVRVEVPLSGRAGFTRTQAPMAGAADSQQARDLALRPVVEATPGAWRLTASGDAGGEWFDGPAHGRRERLHAALGLEAAHARRPWTWSLALRGERWGSASALLPRAGGSVRTGPVVVYANAGAGFRPPSFDELYFASGPVLPNPELRPERSWSGDLGARLEHGPLTAALTAFAATYRDVIVYELYPGFRARPYNVGQAATWGAEAEMHWTPADLVPGLSFDGAATALSTANLEPGANSYGRALPYRPAARVVARVALARERARTALEIQSTTGAYTNRANTRSVDGWADLRGSAGVRLAADVWVSLEARNALDVQDRMTVEGYPLPGRVVLAHLSWEPRAAGGAEENP